MGKPDEQSIHALDTEHDHHAGKRCAYYFVLAFFFHPDAILAFSLSAGWTCPRVNMRKPYSSVLVRPCNSRNYLLPMDSLVVFILIGRRFVFGIVRRQRDTCFPSQFAVAILRSNTKLLFSGF